MSKKDKAQEQQQATVPVDSPAVTLADVLKDIEGVTVSDDKRLRVSAADKEALTERVEDVMKALADNYTVTVSPTYGDAAALGCVWNDLVATPKK
jgi:hypothetical protein